MVYLLKCWSGPSCVQKKVPEVKKNDLFEVYFSIYFSIYLSIYLSFYLFLSFSFFPNSCFSFFFRRQEGIQRQTLNLSPNRFRTGSSKPPCLGMSNPQVGKLLKPMVPFWWWKARVMVPFVPSSLRDLEYTKTSNTVNTIWLFNIAMENHHF